MFGNILSAALRSALLTKLLQENEGQPHFDKILWAADLHNFVESQGFITKNLQLYYQHPKDFLRHFRDAARSHPILDSLVPIWDYTDTLTPFFNPRFETWIPGSYPYTRSFAENVRLITQGIRS